MAKKTEQTVTISKKLVDTMSLIADKYATLLNSEIDSCVNDESVKRDLRKDLKQVEKFEAELDKATRK